MGSKILVGLVFLLTASSCSPQQQTMESGPLIGVFESAPCPVEFSVAEDSGESVKCGHVTVPEFHGEPNGRTLRVAVAIFPATTETANVEPLVISPPGPGTSAIANLGPVVASEVGAPIRALKPVILIENRGLPLSEPPLLCEEIVDSAFDRLQRHLSAEEALGLQQQVVRSCWERLRGEGIDLNAFNFSEIASDMAMVMTALGYEKFSVYGTSAGTIVVQHVIRGYPKRVSSAIMDSTAPLGRRTLQAENAVNGARSIHLLFEACASDSDCSKAYPDLEAKFDQLFARLNEDPVSVPTKDPRTGRDINAVINGDRLAQILFMASAQTPVIPEIPGLIHQLLNGDQQALARFVWAAMPPPGDFSHGLGHSAMCSEFNTFTEDEILLDGRFPNFEESLINMSWGPRALIMNCTAWEVDAIASRTRVAVESDIPTLLLAGQLDSMTPLAWAEEAAGTLGNSQLYEIPWTGHSPTFSGPCPASIALQFLKDPDQPLDTSCLSEMKPRFKLPEGT